MDNKNYFTVVLPLSDTELAMLRQEPSLTDLRATLWNRAADSMKPLLGRICSRISPAVLPGLPPYSVALGRTEPHAFLMCYLAAREAQEKELADRDLRIRGKGRTIISERLDESIGVTVTAFRCDDPELRRELERGDHFFRGDITGAACLYYLGLNKNYIKEEQEEQILSRVDRYAICVADLWPVEG